MSDQIYNVLFLCTHNSARSLMAEAILNNLAVSQGRFKGFSAGSHPSGKPNPFALAQIQSVGLPTEGLRSKDWDEFAMPGGPKWISCLPSVTTRRTKSVRCGLASR